MVTEINLNQKVVLLFTYMWKNKILPFTKMEFSVTFSSVEEVFDEENEQYESEADRKNNGSQFECTAILISIFCHFCKQFCKKEVFLFTLTA